jgi:phospholipid/cholesterol/gamma-HCH transport system ATP-binding protein
MSNQYNAFAEKKPVSIMFEKVLFKRGDRVILDHISCAIPKGKIVAIMGPSGTGKSTMVKLMTGELRPDSGQVMYGDKAIGALSKRDLFDYRRQIGVMLQSNALFNELSVFENVAFPLRELYELPEDILAPLVKFKLEKVGLRNAADLKPSQLSGGMARRVALARAVARDPEIMFYDEPFTGQDPVTRWVLLDLIKRLHQHLKMTSIIVSHQVEMMHQLADIVYILSEGKIVAAGPPSEVFSDSNQLVRQFVDGYAKEKPVMIHYPGASFVEDCITCK